MYKSIIRSYVKRLSFDDIMSFAKKENVVLTSDEVSVIYYYIKV